jgi:hypothetical protein
MIKTCVFVASHISYIGQIDLMFNCLSSLINQTIVPKIYVSISFENETFKKEFSDIVLRHFPRPITTFEFSKIKLFQLEHIHKLTKKYAKNYDIIMFCDDDDTYQDIRVEEFIYAFENYSENDTINIVGGIKEVSMSNDPNLAIPEYWAYGLVPGTLIKFFNMFESYNQFELLRHKFGDMYLRHYLRKVNKNVSFGYVTIHITNKNKVLYHYNIDNPNSICATLKKQTSKETTISNLILQVLECNNNCEFEKFIESFERGSKEEILSSKIKTKFCSHIYRFCQILYCN